MVNSADFDLNLMRAFHVLMEERSVSRAAKRLGLTQSSASNALERLRQALGDRVLEREGNAMVPTIAARELWIETRDAFSQIEARLQDHPAFDAAVFSGNIAIGLDDYPLELLGPALVAELSRQAPGATFALVLTAPGDDAGLFAGDLDLIIGSAWRVSPGLRHEAFFEEDFLGMVASDHLFADGLVTIESYVVFPHVLVSTRGIVPGNVDAALQPLGLKRQVVLATPTFAGAPGFIAGTDRILNIGRHLAMDFRQRFPVSLFELPISVPAFDVSAIWHPRNTAGGQHRWLRHTARAVAATLVGR